MFDERLYHMQTKLGEGSYGIVTKAEDSLNRVILISSIFYLDCGFEATKVQ